MVDVVKISLDFDRKQSQKLTGGHFEFEGVDQVLWLGRCDRAGVAAGRRDSLRLSLGWLILFFKRNLKTRFERNVFCGKKRPSTGTSEEGSKAGPGRAGPPLPLARNPLLELLKWIFKSSFDFAPKTTNL